MQRKQKPDINILFMISLTTSPSVAWKGIVLHRRLVSNNALPGQYFNVQLAIFFQKTIWCHMKSGLLRTLLLQGLKIPCNTIFSL
jgi:hypothetical protein